MYKELNQSLKGAYQFIVSLILNLLCTSKQWFLEASDLVTFVIHIHRIHASERLLVFFWPDIYPMFAATTVMANILPDHLLAKTFLLLFLRIYYEMQFLISLEIVVW